mmetsp:Transcript_26547/g.40281  ORF Transcript_26547/g.40281 Transcript_26547/m.40281 type:complete len:220 (+) Transcript_26547:66-725(+)
MVSYIAAPSHIMSAWVLALMIALHPAHAFIFDAFDKVQGDLNALTRRVTARHILLPSNREVALTLKQKIRTKCLESDRFIIEVFEEAAKRYSKDDTTNFRGGLVGELVPQGYCRSAELDRACFEVDLGCVVGPIETSYGYHLILVSERTNCPKLDGSDTKLVPGNDGLGMLTSSEQVGQIDFGRFAISQIVFWPVVGVAGGLLAEFTAQLGNSLQSANL